MCNMATGLFVSSIIHLEAVAGVFTLEPGHVYRPLDARLRLSASCVDSAGMCSNTPAN